MDQELGGLVNGSGKQAYMQKAFFLTEKHWPDNQQKSAP